VIVSDQEKHRAHIFYVDSRFERLARRDGGVPREQALAQAQSQIEEQKQNFEDWLERELQELSVATAEIDRDPRDAAALDRAERISSEIQDLGSTMGYKLVTFVAGSLCKILEALKAGAAYDKEVVECHVNALLLVRTESYRNLGPDQVPEMTVGLRRVVELASGEFDHKKN
jgi:hypothetical protein